ncbi:cell division protein FtsK, partial [Rathayibacter sp. AY1D2]
GIHIVVAGDRPNSVPTSLNSTIQRRVVLRLAAEDDYLLLGVPKDVLSATSPPGRGVSEGSEVQIAVLGGESNVAIQARKIASLADAMRRQGAVAASPVERLPEVVPLAGLPAVASSGVCIGLADEDLAPIGVDASGAFLVAGSPGGGRTTALASLAAALRRGGRGARVVHLASRRSGLGARPAWSASVVGVPEVAAAADSLTSEIELGRFGPAGSALVIEGLTDFTGTEAEMALDRLVRAGVRAGVFVVGEGESSTWSQSYTLAQPFKAGRRGLLVVPGETDGDTLLGTPLGRIRRADLPPGRGFLIGRGRSVKLQIATDSG